MASNEGEVVGQQPNIELEITDLPRPEPAPAAARRWSPKRPGDLHAPADVPWGGAYGTTGPDAGFALRMVAQRDLDLADGEHLANTEAIVTAVAAARASHLGRAPTSGDVDAALLLVGLAAEGLPVSVVSGLADQRKQWGAGAGHDPRRARKVVAGIPLDILAADPAVVRKRMASGEVLVSA